MIKIIKKKQTPKMINEFNTLLDRENKLVQARKIIAEKNKKLAKINKEIAKKNKKLAKINKEIAKKNKKLAKQEYILSKIKKIVEARPENEACAKINKILLENEKNKTIFHTLNSF